MNEIKDSELRGLLSEAADKERQALKRATLYTAIPVVIGLLLIAISSYQIIRLERSKKTLSDEVATLKQSQEALINENKETERQLLELQNRKTTTSEELRELEARLADTKERAQEAEKALADAKAGLENIRQGKGDPVKQAEVALQNVQAASGGRWVVMGGDKTLDAAQYEVQRANKLGFSNVAIYLRLNSYRTVIEFPDEGQARAKLPEIRARLNDGAYLRDLTQWCPNAQKQDGYYKCQG